jgi:hypothetical protein
MLNVSKSLVFLSVLLVAEAKSGEINLPLLAEVKVAAERGDATSQDKLGDAYVLQFNFPNAIKWYRPAGGRGLANAQWHLGDMLLTGRATMHRGSVKAEPEEAAQWYLKAANQGHERAQVDLGHCYRDGKGVRQDHVQAYKWYSIAARQNNIWGAMYRDPLILKMSPQQVSEAQRQANVFAPHRTLPDEIAEPGFLDQLKLKGISGSKTNRVALINNRTFAVGDLVKIKLAEKMVAVRCLEIRDESVIVSVGGLTKWKELRLGKSTVELFRTSY